MTQCLVDQCCCCIDIRVGCFILGYLQLIPSVILTIGSLVITGIGAAQTAQESEVYPASRAPSFPLLIIGIVLLSISAVILTFVIVLLVGLHKRKPGHVLAYLIYNYVVLAAYVCLFIVSLVFSPMDMYTAIFVVGQLTNLGIFIHYMLVIRTYYYQLREESARPPMYNPSYRN